MDEMSEEELLREKIEWEMHGECSPEEEEDEEDETC